MEDAVWHQGTERGHVTQPGDGALGVPSVTLQCRFLSSGVSETCRVWPGHQGR